MGKAIRIGKLFDIEIDLDLSWFLIFALVTWSLAQHYLTVYQDWSAALRWSLAVLTSLCFFGSVLVHELAHSLVSKSEGIPVPRITLYLFGGASQIGATPRRARDEFWMALVGPLTSLVLAAIFACVWLVTIQGPNPSVPMAMLNELSGYLAGINLILGLFNLLPGFPLDGGRILRSVVWAVTRSARRATQFAVGAGVVVAWLMILAGVWFVLEGDWADGLWIAFLGWFLQSAGTHESRITVVHDLLQGHKVREIPLGDCPHVLKQLTLDVFVENVAVATGQHCFAVMDGDKLLGLVTLERLQAVPRDRWRTTRLAEVMVPLEKLVTVQFDDDLAGALEKLESAEVQTVPIFDGGRFVGMLTPASIIAFLRSLAQQQRLSPLTYGEPLQQNQEER